MPAASLYDDVHQTFQVTGDVTSFEYMIRLANGTYSKATVTLESHGPEALAGDVLLQETFSGITSTPWTGTGNLEMVA